MYCERILGDGWLTTHIGRQGLSDVLTLAPGFVPPLASLCGNHHQEWEMRSVTSSLVTSSRPATSRPALTSRAHVDEEAEHAGYGDKPPTSPSTQAFVMPFQAGSVIVTHQLQRHTSCLEHWCCCLRARTANAGSAG